MIPVYRPSLGDRERAYVNECLDSNWISSKGAFIERFEGAFADFVGAERALSVCNGTVAVHLALAALGIGPGDEVLVPTLTYVASVNPILQLGARPVFVDSLAGTLQMDPADARRRVTPRTKAVVAVHLYGHPCDMDALVALCAEHDLRLVEDCAEAFGTLWRGRHVGSFGDLATYSFYGNKTITTGEGGMVTGRRGPLLDRAHLLKTQGLSPGREYWHEVAGYNFRMTNICAAIGLAQLERADALLERKRAIAGWYAELLAGLPLSLHGEAREARQSYWMCSAILDRAADRKPLREHLAAGGVETRPFFPCVHQMPPYAGLAGALPVAEDLSARGLNLPSYPDLTRVEVASVAGLVRAHFAPAAAGPRLRALDGVQAALP